MHAWQLRNGSKEIFKVNDRKNILETVVAVCSCCCCEIIALPKFPIQPVSERGGRDEYKHPGYTHHGESSSGRPTYILAGREVVDNG